MAENPCRFWWCLTSFDFKACRDRIALNGEFTPAELLLHGKFCRDSWASVTTPWLAIFACDWNPQDFFNSEDAKEEDLRKQFEGLGENEASGKDRYMGVSFNGGTLKSSILIGFSIINHPFWGTTILGNPHINLK